MTQDLFPAFTPAEVDERVSQMWEFRRGFPFPTFTIHCPICSGTEIQARHWRFHKRKAKDNPWRCDVLVKCCTCSYALNGFGVVLSGPPKHDLNHFYTWREVREIVNG